MFKNNRYSIRKFSVGTGSVIIGAMLYLSTPNIVNAEESNVLKEESQSTESTTNVDSNKNIETSNETNETNTKEESAQDLTQKTSTENPTTENDTTESNTSEENAKEDKEEQSDFTIDPINDQTVKSNEAINPIKINVEGSENNTNQVQGLPDGLTYDSSTDTITGNPTTVGNYTITVISKNDSGVQKETTFIINVEEAEEPSTEEPQTNEDSKSTEENTTEEPTSDEQKSDENLTNEDSKEDNKDTTEEPKSTEEDSSEEPTKEEPSKDNNKSTEDSKNDDEDKSKDFSSEEPTNDKDSKTDQSKTDDKNSTKDKTKSDENSTNKDTNVAKKDTTEEPKSSEEDTLEEPSTEEPLNNSSEQPDTANNDLSTSDSENDNNIDPNVDATDLKTTKPLTDKEKEDIDQKSKNKSKTDKNLKALSASSSKVEKEATKADGSPLGGDDVNSKIKSSNVKFQDGTWKKGAAFEIGFDISIPNDVKRNDYFTVHIPKEINPTSADRDNGILLGNDANSIYAKGTYNRSDNSFTFKFTDNVEKYKNNSAHVDFLGLINFKEATKTDNYNLNLKIGDSEYNATRKIEYSTDARNLDLYQDSSVQEKVDDYNPYNTTYTVNGKARTLNNAKVKITPYNGTKKNPDVISQFNKDITKVQILKVTDRNTLNQSGSAKNVAYVDVSSSHNIIFNSDGSISIDLGNTNSTYLIVVNSETSKPFVPETFIEGTIQLSASNIASGSSQSKIGKSKPSSNNSSGVIVDDTTPPVVDKVDNKTTEVNSPIDPIVINANDNSGETVRNDVYGLPDGVTYNSETNTISGTPTKPGTYEVTVISSDKVYNETETTFTITVEDTTAPTVDPVEDQTIEVKTPITDITLNGKDNSGDPVTHNVTGLPDGVTYNEETNTISGTPTKAGNYNVIVITSDEAGNETETTFTITVEDKTAPTVDPVENQTTEVNTPITDIKLTGEDNSGDPVTHNVTGLPDGVTYNEETQTISGTPTTPGNYEITIVTRDEAGNSVETTFTITVEDTLPPTVDPVDDQATEVNTPIEDITLNGKDNSGQPVTHEVSGLPNGVTYNPETNTISGTPTTVGNYDVIVISTDETGNTTETTFTITVEDTVPPTVDPIDNQTTEVNTPITNITLSGEDNSGQPVSHIVSGLPEGVVYDEVSKTISGTPSKTGNYDITVVTRDEAGNETKTTFTITVEDTTAPDVDSVDDQTTEVNSPIEDITLNGKDNSGQPVTHEVSGLPEGVTYDPETNTISGTPTTVGSYEITVVSTDESGNTTETTFTITVEDTTAPVVDTIEDQTTEVNTPIKDVTLNGQDNSGQPVTHEVSGLPEGVSFDPETNTISGTPTTVGSYDVTVVSTDESGNKTETTFTITVEDTTAPTVDPVEDQTTEVNTPIEDVTLNSKDNSGQPVTHEVSGLPEGVTYDPETNTISGTPTTVGSYEITVVSTDESGNTTETTFTITVEDTTAPVVDPVEDQTTEVNTPIEDVKLNGQDNSGKPVTHEVSGLPDGVTFDPETNTISGTPTTVGSYDVTVVSTDESGNKTETTFTITVEDTTAPDVDPVENQTTEVNTAIKDVTLNGIDNSGQPVTHEVSGLPEGVTYDSETNTISGTPTTVGSYDVRVVSTDGSGNKTETTFTITVEDTTAPTVDPVEDQTTEVNTPIKDITLNGKDNSGKPVTHEVSGLPEGVTFNPETNTISGTPTRVGSYEVTVVTTDESGNTTETTFTITVEDTLPPTVDPVEDQTTEVNTPIEDITLNGQDNSGEPVTHEVSGLPEGVSFDPETNTISGTPTTVGSYDVTVVTTDESGNTTETTFTITVEDTTAPDVDPVDDQTTEVNTPIEDVKLNGQDNSGQPVTHEVSGLPESVTYDPETNTISGTPTTVGSYDVTVVTTDESGNTTETTFTIIVEDTTAPDVDPVDDQTTEVNTPIKDVTLNGQDNSGKPITHEVSGLPEGVSFDPETNTITGTPTTVGSYDVTVVTTDESGNKTETTFTITVEDTTAPDVDPVEDQTTEVNTPIEDITLNGKDNSGQPVTHEVSGLPEGVTYDPETNTISGTPTTVGSYDVTVVSTDESGNTTETTFTITVEDTTAPTVDPVDNQTTEVNTPIEDVTLNGQDNSGQPVTHEVNGLPEGVTYDPETNTISGTPTTVGSYDVTVVTTDESGNTTETTFTITVEDTTAPDVDPVDDQTTEVNTSIKDVTLNSKDNSGQPVTHEVSGLPEGVTYDSETNTISGTPTAVGSYDVTVVTTDESGNKTETTFTITVEDTTAPDVDPVEDQTTEVNTPIKDITLNGKDNSGKPVTHEVSGLPEGVTYDPETNTISGTPTTVGSYDVTVVSTDESGNTTETTFTITVEDTTAPDVDPVEDQTTEVNTPIKDVTLNGQDNSGQPVTHEVSGLPESVTYDSETNTISGTPTTVGSYDVTVVSTDESGNTTETTFTITVEDTTAPTVDPVEDQTTEVNTPIEDISLNGKDNSGQPVTHDVSGLPEGVTYDSETNTISGTPTTVGSYDVTVISTDESGNTTETTFTITVEDTLPPTVDSIEDQKTEVNTPITSIELNGNDNSGKPVTHEVSGLPEGVLFDPETNTISGTPTTVGSYEVTVVTTDESGNTTETTFTITVEDTTAPTVDPIEDQKTEVNTPITSIELNGKDNSGQPVTHEVSGLPEGVTFNPETNTISGTPTTVGSYEVTVVTTDESGNTTETTFTITVEDTTAPTVDPIEDQKTEVNTPITSIELNGKDNSGQPVTHEVSGLPEGVTFNPETNTISGTPTTVGSYEVTVVTTDESGNTTETTFTITVEDTTAPDVDPVEDQTTEVNTPIEDVLLNGKDNSGQPVTHEVSGLPEGVTYDPETNTISGTPTTVGSYEITVVSTDESGNTTETTFTITVEDTTAPVVDPVEDQTTEVNTPIEDVTLNGKDNSGQPVTHEVSGLPAGVTYNPETNTISGTPTTVGSYDVTVISTDESGNTTETTFTITVEDTTAPDVDPVDDQTTEVNTPIEDIMLNGKDNSGQPVTHEVSGLPEGVTYDSETNTISGTPTTVGSYEVTVVTTDESGNKTETTFTITVEDTTAPTVDPVEDQTTEVNTPIKDITLNGKDNSGKPVTHEVSGLPEGVTYNPETNTISGTPTKPGEYTVTVVTRDSEGNETTTTFVIIVKDDSSNDGNNPGDDDGDDNSGDNGDDSSNGGNDNSGDDGDDSSNGGNDNSGDNGDDSSNGGNDNSGDNGDDSSNGGNDNSGDNGDDSSNDGNDNSGDNGDNSSNGGNDSSGDNGSNSSNNGNDNSGDKGNNSSNDGNDSKELPDTGEQDKNLTLFASVIALFGGILTFRRKKKDSKTDK